MLIPFGVGTEGLEEACVRFPVNQSMSEQRGVKQAAVSSVMTYDILV